MMEKLSVFSNHNAENSTTTKTIKTCKLIMDYANFDTTNKTFTKYRPGKICFTLIKC